MQTVDETSKQENFVNQWWMLSGPLGSTHDSSAIGPHQDPDCFFGNLSSPFFQTKDLKTITVKLGYNELLGTGIICSL